MFGCSIEHIHQNVYLSLIALKYLPKNSKAKTPIYLQYLSMYSNHQIWYY